MTTGLVLPIFLGGLSRTIVGNDRTWRWNTQRLKKWWSDEWCEKSYTSLITMPPRGICLRPGASLCERCTWYVREGNGCFPPPPFWVIFRPFTLILPSFPPPPIWLEAY